MRLKLKLIFLSLMISIVFIACGGDPGASYVKKGQYNKALAVYDQKISEEYANSDLVKLYLYKASTFAKIPNARGAWGNWKAARSVNARISRNNKNKQELNKLIAKTHKEIKSTLALAAQKNRANRNAAFAKQKPKIYKNARRLEARGNNLAALRHYSAIPDYADSRARIGRLRAKLRVRVNSLWQQGFALYSAESYSRAIRIFSQILAINPAHKNASIYKGKAQAKLKALKKF